MVKLNAFEMVKYFNTYVDRLIALKKCVRKTLNGRNQSDIRKKIIQEVLIYYREQNRNNPQSN